MSIGHKRQKPCWSARMYAISGALCKSFFHKKRATAADELLTWHVFVTLSGNKVPYKVKPWANLFAANLFAANLFA